MSEIVVTCSAHIYPTEDPAKVEKAIRNIFSEGSVKISRVNASDSLLVFENKGLECLDQMRRLLKRERIRDAARKILISCVKDRSIVFELNKQAAYAGHLSFSTSPNESPLGSISVKISASDPLALLDWLAPSTQSRGRLHIDAQHIFGQNG
jgi:predicted RNA binding protein with dsRBD fold (UPF0201 family)